jgi:hypothetical protein
MLPTSRALPCRSCLARAGWGIAPFRQVSSEQSFGANDAKMFSSANAGPCRIARTRMEFAVVRIRLSFAVCASEERYTLIEVAPSSACQRPQRVETHM